MVENTPNPLIPTESDICGLTKIGASGIEWICINPPHDKDYIRRSGDKTHYRGTYKPSSNPKTDQHYWVNRYPYRTKQG
jgi:hypothetical protein